MTTRNNITHYFENILNSIRNMEQNAHIFSQLHTIADELSQLEKYVKNSFETLDNHFQAYIKQINLLSGLIEFQRKVVHFSTPEEMQAAVFAYLQENVPFDHAFIYMTFSDFEEKNNIIASEAARIPLYQKFLSHHSNFQELKALIYEKDLGILLSDVEHGDGSKIHWKWLKAKSAILFPLRMQGKFLGMGVMTSRESLLLNHLSFVNLISGILSLLLFQHFYFFHLKRRLFKQVKLQKILEEMKYAEYFERGPLAIFSLDQKGVILHVNAAGLQTLKSPKENVVGEKFLNFIPREHHQALENLINQLQGGELRYYQCPVDLDHSRRIWDLYITNMELHERFNLTGIFAVDVTTHYYQEQQQRQRDLLNQINQFATMMMGNVNNLLNVLVPNLSLIKSQLPEEHQVQPHLTAMENSLKQTELLMKKFVNYDLSDIEQPTELNLNSIIQDIVERFKETFRENIEFKVSLDPGIPQLQLYPNRITRLIRIFTQNSLEAIKSKGYIKISTQLFHHKKDEVLPPHMFYLPRGKYIELTFEDNGKGIHPAHLPHIFKPFFTTKINNEGVGLGLFVAYTIINELQGHVFVSSEPGRTVFFVYLPIRSNRQMQKALPRKTGSSTSRAHRILVVDDEYNIRSMLKEIFEMNGYTVYTAANGQEGVAIYDQHRDEIDLVILDMVMPVMDGKSTFREIKKRNKSQKVLVITGYSDREDLQEILQNGALAFLNKPFQINDIVEKVKGVLED